MIKVKNCLEFQIVRIENRSDLSTLSKNQHARLHPAWASLLKSATPPNPNTNLH